MEIKEAIEGIKVGMIHSQEIEGWKISSINHIFLDFALDILRKVESGELVLVSKDGYCDEGERKEK